MIMLAISIPITVLANLFVNAYWLLLYYTMGITVDNNWIPFNLMPEYGIPLTTLLKSLFDSFFNVVVVTLSIGFIFRKSIQDVYWGIVCSLFWLSVLLNALYFLGPEIRVEIIISLLISAIFQWLAYKYILCEGGVLDNYFVKD